MQPISDGSIVLWPTDLEDDDLILTNILKKLSI